MTFSEKRYSELNTIREHGVFTYDESEEWIKLCTEILNTLIERKDEK